MSKPTDEQKLAAYEKALPTMEESFVDEKKSEGLDAAAIGTQWETMKGQLKEHFLTDSEMESSISAGLAEPVQEMASPIDRENAFGASYDAMKATWEEEQREAGITDPAELAKGWAKMSEELHAYFMDAEDVGYEIDLRSFGFPPSPLPDQKGHSASRSGGFGLGNFGESAAELVAAALGEPVQESPRRYHRPTNARWNTSGREKASDFENRVNDHGTLDQDMLDAEWEEFERSNPPDDREVAIPGHLIGTPTRGRNDKYRGKKKVYPPSDTELRLRKRDEREKRLRNAPGQGFGRGKFGESLVEKVNNGEFPSFASALIGKKDAK